MAVSSVMFRSYRLSLMNFHLTKWSCIFSSYIYQLFNMMENRINDSFSVALWSIRHWLMLAFSPRALISLVSSIFTIISSNSHFYSVSSVSIFILVVRHPPFSPLFLLHTPHFSSYIFFRFRSNSAQVFQLKKYVLRDDLDWMRQKERNSAELLEATVRISK